MMLLFEILLLRLGQIHLHGTDPAVLGRSLVHPPEPPCGKEFTQMLEDERIGHPALPDLKYVQVLIHRLKFSKKRIEKTITV